MATDAAAVRKGEELDPAGLAKYLRGKIEGVECGIEIQQFPGGHSNLTYLLSAGGREYVLRRAPLGPVAPRAHDMVREFRVLEAVHPHFPPAPQVHLVCEDPGVIGGAFFLMERRRGIVLRDRVPPEIAAHLDYARRISEAFIGCLVQLHGVDIEKHGLTALGKPEGYVERQLRGWTDRWERARTQPSPEMDRVAAWLAFRIPLSGRPTLVHNDFKLDNVMIASDSPDRIEAVLDWEMATVGDPLCDLGLTLCYWNSAVVPGTGHQAITAAPGWYGREELVARYAEKTGRDLSALLWHEVFGLFRMTVILQQIYFRFRRGQTSDQRFRNFDQRVNALTALAVRMVEEAG